MTKRLSDTMIKELQRQRETGEIKTGAKIFDSVCNGLYAFVCKKHISFCYDYNANNRRQKITLGDSQTMSVSEARKKLVEAKIKIQDFRRERHFARLKAMSQTPTPTPVPAGEYLSPDLFPSQLTFAELLKRFQTKNKKEVAEGTAQNKNRMLKRAAEVFGLRPILTITKKELIDYCNQQENTNIAKSFRVLKELFIFASAAGIIKDSPLNSDDIKALNKPAPQGHIPSPKSLPEYASKLAEAFEAIDGKGGQIKTQPEQKKMLMLNQLLPCRSGELAETKWEDIDLLEGTISIHQSKTNKTNVLPLNQLALAILYSLETNKRRKGKLFNLNKATLKGKLQKVEGFSFHSIRSFFESQMLNLKKSKEDCEAVLGHQKDEYRGAYDRAERIERKRELLNFWTDFLCHNETIKALFGSALENLKGTPNFPVEYLKPFTDNEPNENLMKIERFKQNYTENLENIEKRLPFKNED